MKPREPAPVPGGGAGADEPPETPPFLVQEGLMVAGVAISRNHKDLTQTTTTKTIICQIVSVKAFMFQ